MSKLLIDEHPLTVLPGLAKKMGLNEAVVLQQLHYWTVKKQPDANGEVWVYNTLDAWLEQFPWLSQGTLKRVMQRLLKQGVIEVRQPGGKNRTNHYRVVYDRLAADEMGAN